MTIVILILAVMLILVFVGRGKRAHKNHVESKKKRAMSQQEVDEIITVILPTIRNDK